MSGLRDLRVLGDASVVGSVSATEAVIGSPLGTGGFTVSTAAAVGINGDLRVGTAGSSKLTVDSTTGSLTITPGQIAAPGALQTLAMQFQYDDFAVGAISTSLVMFNPTADIIVIDCLALVNVVFAAPASLSITAEIGTDLDQNAYLLSGSMLSAAYYGNALAEKGASLADRGVAIQSASRDVTVTLTADVNLDTMTQGTLTVYLLYVELPATPVQYSP